MILLLAFGKTGMTITSENQYNNGKQMKIQIFLASSVEEFKYDRLAVGDFINHLNKLYHKDADNPKIQNIEYKQNWHEDYLKWICKKSAFNFLQFERKLIILPHAIELYPKLRNVEIHRRKLKFKNISHVDRQCNGQRLFRF